MIKSLTTILSTFVLASTFMFSGNACADTMQTPAAMYFPKLNTVGGNQNGNITIVEFSDANCHYCKELSPLVEKLAAKNPGLRVVYRDLDVLGPSSTEAARVSIAAAQQGKYIEMHNAVFNARGPLSGPNLLRLASSVGVDTSTLRADLGDNAVNLQLRANHADANMLGIDGVPVVVIAPTPDKSHKSVNALVLVAPSYGEMQNAINSMNSMSSKGSYRLG